MTKRNRRTAVAVTFVFLCSISTLQGAKWTVVAWNDLGMHCVDGNDYSVFSILPPFNNVRAQLINSNGKLVKTPTGLTLTFQAVADPTGSINRTSASKTNFWKYVQPLYGPSLPLDMGLAGYAMPGASNTPQKMGFDASLNWFRGDGIPILPYDDQGVKNYYPMMKVVAKYGTTVLASTNVVLPVSDEMDCKACHASGSTSTAAPQKGWVYDPNPTKDYKRNILRLHDERKPALAYLTQAGYLTGGLEATYNSGTPILCAKCHASNALPGTGIIGVHPLTTAVHGGHAASNVIDPTNMLPLQSINNRSACYRCHPGSTTKCLRGVMGNAVGTNGQALIQCQSCHGQMLDVGAPTRTGWLQEPTCQSCHTGTAVKNAGQIRYTSVFTPGGQVRQAADLTFATNANVPAQGFSLYRFSSGHGGLQCEACHGSTHAEYPSSHTNDNLQNIALQGYAGTLTECSTCHGTATLKPAGGPHGIHPVGQTWVSNHDDYVEQNGPAACQTCHGTDYRGTVLSKARTNRTFWTENGNIAFKAGTVIGCYSCHNGPRGS